MDYGGTWRIGQKMTALCRILFIAVQCVRTDVEPVPPPVRQNRADILRHILQIPFIDQTADLPRLFVAGGCRIRIVHDTDKPDPPERKETVDVLFHKLHFACEPGLRFAQHNVKSPCLRVLEQAVECRTPSVRSRIIVVGIDGVDLPVVRGGIGDKHGFLVLDAQRIRVSTIAILLGEPTVDRRPHDRSSFSCAG